MASDLRNTSIWVWIDTSGYLRVALKEGHPPRHAIEFVPAAGVASGGA